MKKIIFDEHAIARAEQRRLTDFLDIEIVLNAIPSRGKYRDSYYRIYKNIIYVCKSYKDKIVVKTIWRKGDNL